MYFILLLIHLMFALLAALCSGIYFECSEKFKSVIKKEKNCCGGSYTEFLGYRFSGNRGEYLSQVRTTIRGVNLPEFKFVRRKFFHTFFEPFNKTQRISEDKLFGKSIYTLSDNPSLLRELQSNSQLRAVIYGMFQKSECQFFRRIEIISHNDELSVMFYVRYGCVIKELNTQVDLLVGELMQFRDSLNNLSGLAPEIRKDPHRQSVRNIYIASVFLLWLGFWESIAVNPNIANKPQYMPQAISISILISLLAACLLIFRYKNSSWFYLVVFRFFVIGLPGIYCLTHSLLQYYYLFLLKP